MTDNPLKLKLATGQPILGIWSIIPSPIVAEIMGLAGLDFQILDMEHGVFDMGTLDATIRACEAAGCSPIVRVPGIAPFTIQAVLDLGAHGVIVPQVPDEHAASTAVRCMKYAPEGTRGYNPFTRAALYANPSTNETGKLNNRFGLASIIIESESAWNALDRILDVPGLDMVYLGVYDMSVALGCKGDVYAPRVIEFVETSTRRIRAAGKAAGLMVKTRAEMDSALELGANVLVFSVDTFVIRQAIGQAVAMFQEACGNVPGGVR